jgi:tight adherence protein B
VTPTTVLAAVAGAMVSAGMVLVVVGLVPTTTPLRVREPRTRPARRGAWARWRWGLAAGAGLLGWVLTGWPVAFPAVAAGVLGLPVLLGTAAQAARGIDRVEAVEDWTRRLADVLALGVGLEQAVIGSVRTAPDPIRGEVEELAARLAARWPTETALRGFADALADPAGDLVVAALILGDRRRGPGLARALASVADAVAEEVAVRRRIEADRAKPRATARAVTLITLGVVVFGLASGTYLAPYGTPLGQLVLAGIGAAFAASLLWMRSMTLTPAQPRLLAPGTSASVPAERGGR